VPRSPSRSELAVDLEPGVDDDREDESEHRDDVGGPRCRLFGAVVRRLPSRW
jgi:hypothetical protein